MFPEKRELVDIPKVGRFWRVTTIAPWGEKYVLRFDRPAAFGNSNRCTIVKLITAAGFVVATITAGLAWFV